MNRDAENDQITTPDPRPDPGTEGAFPSPPGAYDHAVGQSSHGLVRGQALPDDDFDGNLLTAEEFQRVWDSMEPLFDRRAFIHIEAPRGN